MLVVCLIFGQKQYFGMCFARKELLSHWVCSTKCFPACTGRENMCADMNQQQSQIGRRSGQGQRFVRASACQGQPFFSRRRGPAWRPARPPPTAHGQRAQRLAWPAMQSSSELCAQHTVLQERVLLTHVLFSDERLCFLVLCFFLRNW